MFSVLGRIPDPVTGPTVPPAAFHLLETVDAALFPPQAATRAIDELYPWLWVDSEMKEQANHLTVSEDPRLSWPCRKQKGTLTTVGRGS